MNQTLVNFLKQSIPEGGCQWVPEQKQWLVKFAHYDTLLAQVFKVVRGNDFTIEDCYNRPSSGIGLAS